MKRDYRHDARVAIYAMNIRYQIFSFWQKHPWIEETIIPRTVLEKKIYEEEQKKWDGIYKANPQVIRWYGART